MKYKVKVEDDVYEVDIDNLDERPIKANVNGETFEIWPIENENKKINLKIDKHPKIYSHEKLNIKKFPKNHNHSLRQNFLLAPIPGIVQTIDIKIGDHIEIGCKLCVIEAMKMKNVIRSTRSGKIKKIAVVPGQHVQHKDILVEFEQ